MANIKITLLFAIGVLFGAPLFALKNPSLDKTTKEILKLHAIKNNLPEKDHLAALSHALFAKTGIAYKMLLDKIIRAICKTHLNELSTPIFFYTHVLQDIDELMIGASKIAPVPTKSLTQKSSGNTTSYTAVISSQPVIFLGFLTAFALIFIMWEQLEKNSKELALSQERFFELNQRIINHAEQINKNITEKTIFIDGFTSVLNIEKEALTCQENLLKRFINDFSKLTTDFFKFQERTADAAAINERYARSFDPTIESIQKNRGIIQGWLDKIWGRQPPEPVIFEEAVSFRSIKENETTHSESQGVPSTPPRPHSTPETPPRAQAHGPFQTPPRANSQHPSHAPTGGSPGLNPPILQRRVPQHSPSAHFSTESEDDE